MADKQRMPLRIVALIPLLLLLGFHIPLIADGARRKLRVPYFIGMPLLFGLEMAAVDFLLVAPPYRATLLWMNGLLLLAVITGSFIIGCLGGRQRLIEGPGNCEGFAPAHMVFLLLWIMVPMLLKARSAWH